jgi:hypothetical protein
VEHVDEELRLPLDAAGFSRRECPRCQAHFKVRWSRREARVLASALARRVGHLNAGEAEAGLPRHCPYCGARAEGEAWWTTEQLRWVEAQARGLDREVRWHALRAPLERPGANPRPTYVAIPPRPGRLPPLRDPAATLARVYLPCCGEELAVSTGWVGPVRCHLCGFVHERGAGRDIGVELARLRAWVE